MRPLRLTLEGFTCFKERQEPLDLEGLDLFAIAGPTGAGKSSLLDAMIFALFGKVPRLRQGLSELISLGASRAAVSLDFRLARREFRVFRAVHRARSTSAQLDERVDGMYQSLSDGVRETDRQVQELLGLDYDTFVRAVILPQGDFAAFLKSSASKQREILRKLLRLDIYEEMRALARRRGQQLETRLEEAARRFEEDYAPATAEQLEDLRRQVRAAKDRLQGDVEALAVARTELETARQRRRQSDEMETKAARRQELEAQRSTIEAETLRLQAAQRAIPLLPLLDRCRDEGERLQQLRRAAGEAEDAWRAAEASRRRVAEGAEERRAREAEISALRLEGQRLDRLLEWVEPRQKALHEIETLAAQQVAKWAKLQALEHQGEEASGRRAGAAATLAASEEELHALGYDAELERRLDGVREPAGRLRHLRQDGAELATQEGVLRRAFDQAASQRDAAQGKVEEAKRALVVHRLEEEAAAEDLRLAEREHQASLLRQGLEAGEPCPVCTQPVEVLPVPSTDAHHSLQPLRARWETAQQGWQEAMAQLASVERGLVQAEALASERRESWRQAVDRTVGSAEEVGRLAADLQIALGDNAPGDTESAIEERVLRAVEEMAQQRQRHLEISQRTQRQRHHLQEVERQQERLDDEAQALRGLLAELDQRMQRSQEELKALQERFAEGAPDEDLEDLRRRVDERLEALEVAQRRAGDEERRLAVELATAEQRRQQSAAAVEGAAAEVEGLESKVRQQLDGAGFETSEAARDAVMDDTIRVEMEAAHRHYERQVESLDQRLDELRHSLGDGGVSADDLTHKESAVERLEEAERRGREALGRLDARSSDVAERHRRRAELELELVGLRRDLQAYQGLQKELAGQRFQAFLLEKVFDDLVRGATQRLLVLSQQRYELAFDDGAFVVIDHDNASQRRSADTLSGGETFLASLALALELCEQVQREAGALTVESLFIDEGFGTLDPETLETVTGAIEALPHGGRMVGIITHLPELTERLPWRVMVSKHPEGSRYRVEEG